MSSSTLPFKRKGWVFCLGLAASFAVAVAYTFFLNPELAFWKKAVSKKLQWADQLRQQGEDTTPVTWFSGGSTCGFQIDSGLLFREHDIKAVNFGLHAGMGLDGTVGMVTSFVKPGDRLVLNTEPVMLAGGGGQLTSLAGQMIVIAGDRPNAFFQSKLEGTSPVGLWWTCRPGLYHTSTMLGKVLLKKPLYRYRIEDLQEGGLATTDIQQDFAAMDIRPAVPVLSAKGSAFLIELKDWAKKKGVDLIYLMPVQYISPPHLAEQRRINGLLLQSIAEIIPVWRDSYDGASDVASHFADTTSHMTYEAAKARTRDLIPLFNKN